MYGYTSLLLKNDGSTSTSLLLRKSPPLDLDKSKREESEDDDADKGPCETSGKTQVMIGGAVVILPSKVSDFKLILSQQGCVVWKRGEGERNGEEPKAQQQKESE